MIIREACVENFSKVPLMISKGANRLELNNDLSAGGTTPSFGVIKKTVAYAHKHQVPVIVMIRPRGGNFVYNSDEVEIMCNDIKLCSLLNVDGVTFGCLTKNGDLDKNAMTKLISIAHGVGMQVVMHMAFDAIPINEQSQTVDWLINNHVCRILTHGSSLDLPVEECIPDLQRIIKVAADRIEILPGGGVNIDNYQKIAHVLGVTQVHGTRIVTK